MWLVPVLVLAAVLLLVASMGVQSGIPAPDLWGLLVAASVVWLVWAVLYMLPLVRGGVDGQ